MYGSGLAVNIFDLLLRKARELSENEAFLGCFSSRKWVKKSGQSKCK